MSQSQYADAYDNVKWTADNLVPQIPYEMDIFAKNMHEQVLFHGGLTSTRRKTAAAQNVYNSGQVMHNKKIEEKLDSLIAIDKLLKKAGDQLQRDIQSLVAHYGTQYEYYVRKVTSLAESIKSSSRSAESIIYEIEEVKKQIKKEIQSLKEEHGPNIFKTMNDLRNRYYAQAKEDFDYIKNHDDTIIKLDERESWKDNQESGF